MLKRIFFVLQVFICTYAHSQATIKGRVTEKDGETPIEFAIVRLMQNDSVKFETVTDERGRYTLTNVPSSISTRPAKYDMVVTAANYKEYKLTIEIYGRDITVIRDIKLILFNDKLTYKKLYKLERKKNRCTPRPRIRLFR